MIERLIGAAILAPSALKSQPWAFAVLLDSERIDLYAERARIWMLENATATPEAAPGLLEEADYSMFYHAPALVIVMAQSSASQAIEDCCIAADNLMLASRNEGIGSLFLALDQGICFPICGIPKVSRADYIIFDRGRLKYLNLLERFNCMYCSYANGLCAYATEVAARTEQHWWPIKHARRLRAPHSRYPRFFDYGDAQQYRRQIEAVRSDFVDIRSLTSTLPDTSAK